MGKGDIRSRKGKIFRGTFGKTRPHKVANPVAAAPVAKTETAKTEAKPKAKAPKAEKKA